MLVKWPSRGAGARLRSGRPLVPDGLLVMLGLVIRGDLERCGQRWRAYAQPTARLGELLAS